MDSNSMRKIPPGYFNFRFNVPEYTSWTDESESWKTTCYVGDWSFLSQRWFRGRDALRLFSDISVNNFEKFEIGQAKHVIHTNKDGKVIHEGILMRFGAEEFVLHGRGNLWANYKLRQSNYAATTEIDDWHVFQVSGPKAVHAMESAAGESLRDIGFMRFREITVAGHKVQALRQGMAGEIGFEIQGSQAHSKAVYDAILEAGEPFGIRRMGGRVSQVNHLEACFPTILMDYMPAIFDDDMEEYRAEFESIMPDFATGGKVGGSYEGKRLQDYYRSPIELGWGRNVHVDHDFIGRDALAVEKANPKKTIRSLVWSAEDVLDVHASLFGEGDPYPYMDMPRDQRIAMQADKVIGNGRLVGVSTSRGYSYTFRKMLSLVVIDLDHAEPGTEVTVVWGAPGGPQKDVRAVVAPAPYKQDNRRLDLSSI